MQNKSVYTMVLFFSVALVLLLAFQVALAEDSRINQVHHFGGDALYCDEALGCWLLDQDGNRLWEVTQTVIDAAMTTACETGLTQTIDAGMGTYGPSVIKVSCYAGYEPFLTYVGYDEWGKPNDMHFPPNYMPVNAPIESAPEPKLDPCSTTGSLSTTLSICPT